MLKLKKKTMTAKAMAANRRNAQSPNIGRPLGARATHTIETVEARKLTVQFVNERLIPILEALYEQALDGNVVAAQELLNRAHGKPMQAVEVTGKDGNPIVFMPLELIQKHRLDVIDGNQSAPQLPEPVNDATLLNG